MVLGKHALIDIYNVDHECIDDIEKMKKIIKMCCIKSSLHIVDSKFFKFEPIGLSGVVFLSESHVAVHSWPEYNFISVDVFTCGCNTNPEEVCKLIAKTLNSNNYKIRLFDRGVLDE